MVLDLLKRTDRFLTKNPAIELVVDIGMCVAIVAPFWIIAGRDVGSEYAPTSRSKNKEGELVPKENFYTRLLRENSNLKKENEQLRKKLQLRNKVSDTSSSKKI